MWLTLNIIIYLFIYLFIYAGVNLNAHLPPPREKVKISGDMKRIWGKSYPHGVGDWAIFVKNFFIKCQLFVSIGLM